MYVRLVPLIFERVTPVLTCQANDPEVEALEEKAEVEGRSQKQ